VRQKCRSKLILFGEGSLRRALIEYGEHYHRQWNHQGKGNALLFPEQVNGGARSTGVECRPRLGGLLKYYARAE